MYIAADSENVGQIIQGVVDGKLLPWRKGLDGRQWYKTPEPPMIRGVNGRDEADDCEILDDEDDE